MLIVRGNGRLIALELKTQPSKELESEPATLAGPYFGQKPPGLEPRIFAPEILSRTKPEWAFCVEFSPDHTEFYFSREDPDRQIDQQNRLRLRPQIAKGGRSADVFLPDALVVKLRKFWRHKTTKREGYGPKNRSSVHRAAAASRLSPARSLEIYQATS
jgi:hypothetical protein